MYFLNIGCYKDRKKVKYLFYSTFYSFSFIIPFQKYWTVISIDNIDHLNLFRQILLKIYSEFNFCLISLTEEYQCWIVSKIFDTLIDKFFFRK
jgi:hypothetical protein